MLSAEELHEYTKKFEWALGKLERSNLTQEEKKLVKEFCTEVLANGVSKARAITYINNFIRTRKMLSIALMDVTKNDLVKLLTDLHNGKLSDYTKADMRRTIKKFYQWKAGMIGEEYPDIVKWIKIAGKKKYKTLEEIPTLDELFKIQSLIRNYRDKALFWVALETGARPSAVLSPQLKDVKIEKDYIRLSVRDKKGERYLWLVVSRRFLLMWLEHHPLKRDPEAPLWINQEGITKFKPLKWHTFKQIVQKYAKRAEIKKRIYPYLFRYRDASWKSDWMNDEQLSQDKGWVEGSDMPRVYVRRSGILHRNTLLKHFGIETPPNPDELKIKQCNLCKERNPPVANYCLRCGWKLEEEVSDEHRNTGIVRPQTI